MDLIKDSYNQNFNQALELAERGRLPQSFEIFQKLKALNEYDYCTIINYGVIALQQAKVIQARMAFKSAIQVDCYNYIGYYNLFILNCCEMQRIKKEKNINMMVKRVQTQRQILTSLYLTLSCLYAEIGQAESDPKLCTKSIFYCEQNSKAYLTRAGIYQQQSKNKLAQNDYESAIYYDKDNPLFSMKRAEYLWKNNRILQANQQIRQYWEKKHRLGNQRKKQDIQKIRLLSQNQEAQIYKQLICRQISQEQLRQFQNTLSQKCLQLSQLLRKIRATNQKAASNWLLKIPSSPKSTLNVGKIFQEKSQSLPGSQSHSQVDILKDEIKSEINQDRFGSAIQKLDKNQQSKNQEEYEEDSRNISQQIEKLSKQIRLQTKVSQPNSQSNTNVLSQQSFLTEEIKKTSKQIENMKSKKVQEKKQKQGQNFLYPIPSTESIPVEQINKYSTIILQIKSAQVFDPTHKQQSKIHLTYGNQHFQTDYSVTNNWKQKFTLMIDHKIHRKLKSSSLDFSGDVDNDFEIKEHVGQILIELQIKSKSIWSSKKFLGKGYINIYKKGQIKCILSNQQEKTGIVYFKLKLQ